ncbi:hypothetical protein DICVIV_12720 [Dictyocaulus viviparus]|uniref:Uncharacterized protein n=1 Tax=Dictyocaulus viviparus TaxID=29172 RepID=A0A0D8XCD3_DICVI|nr:hypothetical protein DICVIV_12720 [Dictyocaulus viviparus]
MYLMPLAADEEPPAVLLPFDGPGLPQRHSPMIICIMVIYGPGYSRGLQLKSPQEMQLNERRLTSTLSCESSPKCASIHYNFDNDKYVRSHFYFMAVCFKS